MSDAPIVFKKRARTGNIARKAPLPTQKGNGSDDDSDDSIQGEDGVRIKKRRRIGLEANLVESRERKQLEKSSSFAGDISAAISNLDDATKQSNWYEIDPSKVATSRQSDLNVQAERGTDTSYKGTANYDNFIQKKSESLGKPVGPVKASTTIRTITVTDFAPDVCKDYKQTGFCGFGDSCKFLHAREDCKQGWQLDKEWENVTKGKKLAGTVVGNANRDAQAGVEDEEESMLDDIPFACIICREPYKNPVVTKCKHYFCEACALQRYRTKGKKGCAACGADTGGTFNVAKALKRLLDRKRERLRKQEEQSQADASDVECDNANDNNAEDDGNNDN